MKESEDAEQAFETAVASRRTAALVERVTDDIFAISVSSIPARKQVTTKITFIMDLLDEGLRDHVRLQLPLTIFNQYGPLPAAMVGAASASNTTRVDVNVYVQMSDTIHAIRSVNHPIKVSQHNTHNERKSQRMSASWASQALVPGDFVLTIYTDGLDKPRCFAEVDAESQMGRLACSSPSFLPSTRYVVHHKNTYSSSTYHTVWLACDSKPQSIQCQCSYVSCQALKLFSISYASLLTCGRSAAGPHLVTSAKVPFVTP